MEKAPNEIGALWEKTGKKGAYMTGTINGERVVVFKNTNKRGEKSPDWRVLKSVPREPAAEPEHDAAVTDEGVPF